MADREHGAAAPQTDTQGGDPVCWLHRVCPGCGRMNSDPGPPCEECGLDEWPGHEPGP